MNEEMMMEEEQQEKKGKLATWWDDNKEWAKPLGLMIGGVALFYAGVFCGTGDIRDKVNAAEANLHMNGFLKYCDPRTGEEISGYAVKRLIGQYYKKGTI